MKDEIDRTEDGVRYLKRTDNEDMMTWWIIGNGRFALQFSLMRVPFSHLASADVLRSTLGVRNDAMPDYGMHFHPSLTPDEGIPGDCELIEGGKCHFSANLRVGAGMMDEVCKVLGERDSFNRDDAIFYILKRQFDTIWPLPGDRDG